jgi:hypothetical protein
MSRSHLLLGSMMLALAVSPALAVTVQIPSSRDNTLYEDPAGALSNGAGTGMFAGRSSQSQNSIRRGLVFFDVASMVPAGSTITSATLTLFQSSTNTADQSVGVHRLFESWGEGASNATSGNGGSGTAAAVGDATWLHRTFSTTLWTIPGGFFDGSASASTTVGGNGMYSWSSAALVADAQLFLDNSAANFGWLLRGNEQSSGTSKRFATREEPIAMNRPVLTLEYVVPAPAATTMTLALALGAARRRRTTI